MISRASEARTSILDAAELLFAERGFAATTIKSIGTSSRQNTALIYYYFDSKATLYKHVLDRLFSSIAADADTRAPMLAGPEEIVRAVIESQVAILSARPHLSSLIAREMMDWRAAHAREAIEKLAGTLFERLHRAIESGQQTGQFRTDLSPRFVAISIVAQVAYLLFASPVAGILLGRGPSGPTADDIRAFGRHAVAFALSALQAIPDGAPTGRGGLSGAVVSTPRRS